jgi:hypothetical protein
MGKLATVGWDVGVVLTVVSIFLLIARIVHKLLTVRFGALLRFELERQLVDLTCEFEGDIVAILEQRDSGAGVLPDVEGFVLAQSPNGNGGCHARLWRNGRRSCARHQSHPALSRLCVRLRGSTVLVCRRSGRQIRLVRAP